MKYAGIILILIVLSFPLWGVCGDFGGKIYDKNHKETGYWRYDRGTNEIIIYDEHYEETGRVKKNTYGGYNVYDEKYEKVGEIEEDGKMPGETGE